MSELAEAPVGEVNLAVLYNITALHFGCTATAFLQLQVVFPGQILCKIPSSGQLRLGPGLQPQAETVCTIKSGILHKTKTGKLWVEGRQKRWCLLDFCSVHALPFASCFVS